MIKLKQLFGIVFFICIYEIISLHPFDAEIFGIFYFNNFQPIKYFQFYNPNNLFFYLAPIMLVTYVFSLIRIFKENSSSFWKISAYLLISIYVIVEMLDFLIKYNSHIFLNLKFDWLSLLENLGFTQLSSSNLHESPILTVIFVSIISNQLSRILIILLLLMIMFMPIISYITLRKKIKTTSKIREEIKEQTKISKKIFFIKPMNLIFFKQRLRFFKDFDKKQIYRKDPSYFQGKKKKLIICFSCGLFLLIIWFILNLFLDPVGTMYILIYENTEINFKYYSIWIILPFRIMLSLSFGYGLFLLIKISKKISKFLNLEFEQSLIRNQKLNGLRNKDDTIIKNIVENHEFEEKNSS